MKIRLVVALVGLAIGFTMPILAQQKEPTPSEQDHQLVDAFNNKIDEAYKNNDPAAVAAFYAEDAVFVTDTGLIYGREAIQKHFADLFKQVHFSNHTAKTDQYSPYIIGTAGNEMWAAGEWSTTLQGQNFGPVEAKGYWSAVFGREGDVWKKRWLTWNTTPPPAK